ncbi:hypothetical protein FRACYDRAFT_238154 [Fragilariopsis cylindrus CCMP1102]|uniref:Uncharacterized protein n=1 Tax=Fragilariopsis cylindrus CCMP1102 TaxID=635003 RepID=A0A1E7FHW1_9STRA|nr:hypothetical protein FRACYDRAFT_238154 [Fragilariopsis cylindrus CCMP1102]|eukprot:OEU17727.1 hypothetical protein FRACYDRAFT_238154 [Fragilariopsis cylindrus CCMP1102]
MKLITASSPSSQKLKNKSYATKKKKMTTKSNGKEESSKGDDATLFIKKNLNDIIHTKKKKKNGVPSTIIVGGGGDHDDDDNGNNNFENDNDNTIVPPPSKNNMHSSTNDNNPVVVVDVLPPHNNDSRRGTPASAVQILGSISSSSSLFPLLPLRHTVVSPETIILEGGGEGVSTSSTPVLKSSPKRVSLDHSYEHQLDGTTSNNVDGGYLFNNNNDNNNNDNNHNSSMLMSGMSSTMVGSMMMNSSFIANGVANSMYGTSVMDGNNNIINCTSSDSIRESLGYHYGFIGSNNQDPNYNYNSVQQQQQHQHQHQHQHQQRYRNGFGGAVVPSTPAPPSTPTASTTSTNTTTTPPPPPPPMLPLVAQTSQRTFTAASTLVSIMSTKMMALGGSSSPIVTNIITNKRARTPDPMHYELFKSKSNIKSIITNTPSSNKKKKHKKTHHHRREFSNSNIFDHARLSLTYDFSTAAHNAGLKKTIQDDTDEDDDDDDDVVVTTTTITATTTATSNSNHPPFKRIPRRFVDDPSLPTIKGGMRLTASNDKQHLNSLHCFVRSELLEVFVLDDIENDEEEDALINNPYRNRVGLRCVHCGLKSKKDRHGTSMSTFFPKSIQDIYRGVCTWQRIHFKDCHHMPEHFREKYDHLKEIDRTRGKKAHWVKSAREMGFRNADEDRSGVIYDPDGKVAAATAAAIAEGSSVTSESSVESELFAASTAVQAITGVTTMSSSLAEYQEWAC